MKAKKEAQQDEHATLSLEPRLVGEVGSKKTHRQDAQDFFQDEQDSKPYPELTLLKILPEIPSILSLSNFAQR
ncbi:MAG TPA: hypothetical protein PKC13_26530 [Blastocatellia bacterium]|nr:hypothetical protein [Blastocatellia bacterium]HMV81744.1 hypothetical protein [Blastocatellia bacterium]HMX29171.1 hypothetical protein [Blastocatellia bacterium]HNG34015.1 hypothetical protein [Blastocatellia bacterium]